MMLLINVKKQDRIRQVSLIMKKVLKNDSDEFCKEAESNPKQKLLIHLKACEKI